MRRIVKLIPEDRGRYVRTRELREYLSLRERFRRWALLYWPEALR